MILRHSGSYAAVLYLGYICFQFYLRDRRRNAFDRTETDPEVHGEITRCYFFNDQPRVDHLLTVAKLRMATSALTVGRK